MTPSRDSHTVNYKLHSVHVVALLPSKKGLEFTLSPDQCVALFQGDCYFCGQTPSERFTKKGLKGSYTFSSIDRTDSTMGYVHDNVVSCCTACNFLKGNHTNTQFLTHIRKICNHLK